MLKPKKKLSAIKKVKFSVKILSWKYVKNFYLYGQQNAILWQSVTYQSSIEQPPVFCLWQVRLTGRLKRISAVRLSKGIGLMIQTWGAESIFGRKQDKWPPGSPETTQAIFKQKNEGQWISALHDDPGPSVLMVCKLIPQNGIMFYIIMEYSFPSASKKIALMSC